MSAILSADDLNDFISPGVACIKPVQPTVTTENSEYNENGEVDIQLDSEGNPLEISQIDGKQKALSPAQISLSDCLACSGCITSAEEILVAQHSHNELIKALKEKHTNDNHKVFVASISHQSRASLATAFNLSIEQIDRLLINLFINQMGFAYIVGTSLGRKLSLINESKNLIARKEANFEGPTLSSICPGWVLYAEKTHPYVLPRVSPVKSPQQITGCLLKSLAAHELGTSRSNIYHLSIMPCFDKKLESARPEINEENQGKPVNDVDCVLTAKELVTLLEEHSGDFQLLPDVGLQKILQSPVSLSHLYAQVAPKSWPFMEYAWANDSGSASGGYGYTYLKMYQNHLILLKQLVPQNFSIKTIEGRNADVYDMNLMYEGKILASTSIVNGFRNIQNLVRKLKPSPKAKIAAKLNPLIARRRVRLSGKTEMSTLDESADSSKSADPSKSDYVEIMACPNGCINGGGQINPPTEVVEKDWLQSVLSNYADIPMFDISASDNIGAVAQFINWSEKFCIDFEIKEERLLTTYFNEVEKPTDPNSILLGAKW